MNIDGIEMNDGDRILVRASKPRWWKFRSTRKYREARRRGKRAKKQNGIYRYTPAEKYYDIHHGLGTTSVLVYVYDSAGHMPTPDFAILSPNLISVGLLPGRWRIMITDGVRKYVQEVNR